MDILLIVLRITVYAGIAYSVYLWLQVLYWKVFIINPILKEGPSKVELDKAVERTYWQIHNNVERRADKN